MDQENVDLDLTNAIELEKKQNQSEQHKEQECPEQRIEVQDPAPVANEQK